MCTEVAPTTRGDLNYLGSEGSADNGGRVWKSE